MIQIKIIRNTIFIVVLCWAFSSCYPCVSVLPTNFFFILFVILLHSTCLLQDSIFFSFFQKDGCPLFLVVKYPLLSNRLHFYNWCFKND